MEIKEIKIREVFVPDIPQWGLDRPESIPTLPVVTQQIITGQIGFPIVDVPGCVKARETRNNESLIVDDEVGNLIVCDPGKQPVFEPMDWNPNNLEPVIEKQERVMLPPPMEQPKSETKKEENENSQTSGVASSKPGLPTDGFTEPNPCPRPDDPPIGSKGKFGTARVESYRLNANGECITNWTSEKPQDIAFTYLPPPPVALTTAAIAATAVTSSVLIKPLSDALLKIVKPLTKRLVKRVLSRLGKKPKVLSVRERRLAQKALKK